MSPSSRSALKVGPLGYLSIFNRYDLDRLLSGRTQDADDARQRVRTLVIANVDHIPDDWPLLPSLQHLSMTADSKFLQHSPRALHASRLPALQSLTLRCQGSGGIQARWACPVLSGRLQQLQDVTIESLAVDADAIGAVLLQPALAHLAIVRSDIGDEGCANLAQILRQHACPSLARLQLEQNKIGAKGCAYLAQVLRQRGCPNLVHLGLGENNVGDQGCAAVVRELVAGCPDLQHLDLSSNKIAALPDALGELRSITCLLVSDNCIARIQPALYSLILRLKTFSADRNPLQEPPMEVYNRGPGALKRYVRDARRRGVEELRTARIMLLGDSMHGKTSLCRSLPEGAPCSRVQREERTHALEIHDWVIAKPGAKALTIKLWDFAGHQVYYATHRSFFSRLCIYVLVAWIDVDDEKMQGVVSTSIEWLMSICKAVPGGAQVVLVGTFPHDQREKNERVLQGNLEMLEHQLRKADRERVRVWNASRSGGGADGATREQAKPAEICGVFWVDCHSRYRRGDHNLGPIAAKLEELAEKMVRDNQRLSGSYIDMLEAHKDLCKMTSAGVSSLQAFRDRMGDISDGDNDDGDDWPILETLLDNINRAIEDGLEPFCDAENWPGGDVTRDALQFANDVGILQYYPHIDREIVFINPLFLVQAFGVLIYDKKAFSHYVTGRGQVMV